jgi:hypothetical protein
MILHKTLSFEEALEYLAYAVMMRDLPDGFDGKITCELNDDGSIDIYAAPSETEEKENNTMN